MFDNLTVVIVIATLWFVIGLDLSLTMSRRGHSGFSWLVLGTLLGPFAVVLAVDASHHDEKLKPVSVGHPRPERRLGVDVLVGYDGSPGSLAAIEAPAKLLGDRLGRLTVATVVPFDNLVEAEQLAIAALRRLSDASSAGEVVTDLKVLHGRPAEALREWGVQDGYELIAVGSRGAGMSKRLLGSAAYELARGGKVPVLVVGEH